MKLTLQRRDKAMQSVAQGRHRKSLRRRTATYHRAKVATLLDKSVERGEPGAPLKLAVPTYLSLRHEAARSTLLQFFTRLRKAALSKGMLVNLDFSQLSHVEPSAALLLFAEIDRIVRLLGTNETLSAKLPTKQSFKQLLQQLGILEKLNAEIPLPMKANLPDNVRHWETATGVSVDEEAGSFLDTLEGRIAPSLSEGVWKALSEALVNSVQHAYLEPRGDGQPDLEQKRWWMLTEERDGQLTGAVCDLGIGIRRSLPLRWSDLTIGEIFRSIRSTDKDVAAIRAALVIGATRTGEVNRGQGLPQIWNGMKREDVGGMAIFSGKGFLSYAADDGTEHERQYVDSILGTLIMWTVRLSETGSQ